MSEPIYCIGKLGQDPATIPLLRGQAELLAAIPTMPEGQYIVARDGEPWGRAQVAENGVWQIEARDFAAGPGYLIV